jgi:protein gp37
MGQETIIAWTDHTFNIAWGCRKISPGCDHCYADTLSSRYGASVWGDNPRRVFGDTHWQKPVTWNDKARKAGGSGKVPLPVDLVFTSSMCDVFEDDPVITEQRSRLWNLIRRTPYLHWQILTKRANRIEKNLPRDWGHGYPNVWLGVSIENQTYDWRADALRKIPAAVRFVSYEPALGPLRLNLEGLDWIIFGGESGPGWRQMDPQWARDMRKDCEDASVSFFFKQSAAPRTEMGTKLDGETVRFYPKPRFLPA